MSIITFIPVIIATLSLAIASFSKSKNKKEWLIVAFVFWLMIFVGTLLFLGVFS